MSNPTTPFSWQMPTATDLVTDLPADFAVFGQAVATSMADLLGGASGYILSKASATDMDFAWIANDQGDITGVTATSPLTGGGSSGAITVGIQASSTSQSGAVQLSDSTSTTSSVLAATPTAVKSAYDLAAAAIPKSTVTTNGDVIYATGSSAVTRLGIGSAGQVLTVAAGIPSWATPSTAAGLTLITSQTIGTTVSSVAVTGVFSATYDNYKIVISGGTVSAGANISLQLGSTTTGYYASYARVTYSTAAANLITDNNGANFSRFGAANTNGLAATCDVLSPNLTKNTFIGGTYVDPGTGSSAGPFGGFLNDTTAYTAFTIAASTGTFTGGTIRVYGYKNS